MKNAAFYCIVPIMLVNLVHENSYPPLFVLQEESHGGYPSIVLCNLLTHWGQDKMATTLQMTFSNAFFLNENVIIAI